MVGGGCGMHGMGKIDPEQRQQLMQDRMDRMQMVMENMMGQMRMQQQQGKPK